ncbi:MAG: YceD family protein [Solirubrobacterales bacterium]
MGNEQLGSPRMASSSIELSRLALQSGGGRRLEPELTLQALDLGGQAYEVLGGPTPMRVDVSRTSSGWAFRLRFDVTLAGPCTRCLSEAERTISVDAREVDEAGTEDEELSSPYVAEDVLDLGSWARDALVLSVPATYLCSPDCAGLCHICGQPLKDGAHDHAEQRDPRWDRLRELKLD